MGVAAVIDVQGDGQGQAAGYRFAGSAVLDDAGMVLETAVSDVASGRGVGKISFCADTCGPNDK